MFFCFFLFYLIIANHSFAQLNDKQAGDALSEKYVSALYLLGEKKNTAAITAFQEIISDAPHFALAYRNLVETYLLNNQAAEAEAYFNKLLADPATRAGGYYGLSRLAGAEDAPDESINYLKKCILQDPGFDEAYGPYGGLAEVCQAANQLKTAEDFYRQLLNENPDNALACYGLGRTFQKRYDWDNALAMLNRARRLNAKLKYIYHSYIYIYEQTGNYKKALDNCEKLIETARAEKDLNLISYARSKIGGLFYFMGDYRAALNFFSRSLDIASKIGAKRREGIAINNIGAVHAILGNFKKAEYYFEFSLDLIRKGGATISEIRALMNIGLISKDQGNFDKALHYLNEALDLAEQTGYTNEKTYLLTGIGETYLEMKDYDDARKNFAEALRIAVTVEDRIQQGYVSRNMGSLYHQTGDFNEAIHYFREALAIADSLQDAQIMWEAKSGIGASYLKLRMEKEALHHLEDAVAIFDSIRHSLNFETLGGAFLQDKFQAYPLLIELLAREGNLSGAFETAEKYKAKLLLNLLTQGQPVLNTLIPDSIRIGLKRINMDIEDLRSQHAQVMRSENSDKAQLLQLDQKITNLELKKAQIKETLKNDYSAFYAITSSDPVTIPHVQREILNDKKAVIEFIVGQQNTSVFIIRQDTTFYRQLPVSHDDLRALLYEISPIFSFSDAHRLIKGGNMLNAAIADFSLSAFHKAYQQVFKPLEIYLDDIDEIVVVPDDLLYYLPFEALIADTGSVLQRFDFKNARYLLHRFNIAYAPSVSVLNPALYGERQAEKNILAFGNPDYSRFNEAGADTIEADERPRYDFVSLPNAENEVRAIGRQLGSSKSKVVTGSMATETEFRQNAAAYKVIHLATHYIVNDREPLYSNIILNRERQSEADGLLQPFEIFNLNLNADLVVLSACNTASGKLQRGEGIIGLSRAFQFAGVPSLVVSLWNVDDEATGIIMKHFYEFLSRGLKKNEALRNAKLAYLESAEGDNYDPFYWAPFILIGSDNAINLPGYSFFYNPLFLFILILLVVAGGSFIYFKRIKLKRSQ